jgi:hypothetical protein
MTWTDAMSSIASGELDQTAAMDVIKRAEQFARHLPPSPGSDEPNDGGNWSWDEAEGYLDNLAERIDQPLSEVDEHHLDRIGRWLDEWTTPPIEARA